MHDGVYAWYIRNQELSLDLLLRDLNIDEALVQNQLQDLLNPIIQELIRSDYLRDRARYYLEQFYYSDQAQSILIP